MDVVDIYFGSGNMQGAVGPNINDLEQLHGL